MPRPSRGRRGRGGADGAEAVEDAESAEGHLREKEVETEQQHREGAGEKWCWARRKAEGARVRMRSAQERRSLRAAAARLGSGRGQKGGKGGSGAARAQAAGSITAGRKKKSGAAVRPDAPSQPKSRKAGKPESRKAALAALAGIEPHALIGASAFETVRPRRQRLGTPKRRALVHIPSPMLRQLSRFRVLRFFSTCCVVTSGGVGGKGRRAACRPGPGGSSNFVQHRETVGRSVDGSCSID